MTTSARPSRRSTAVVVLGASFAVVAFLSLGRTPYGAAFGFSDHFTHMNAARLFPRIGTALWRTPIDRLFPPGGDTDRARALTDVRSAEDLRVVPGWPANKPFVGGWTHIARPYPPGDLVIVAPVALLYHFTRLSFSGACHLLILTFLAFAHAAFAIVWLQAPRRDWLLYAAAGIASYAYVVFWTARGFYDSAAMVPVLWCAGCLERRRWLAAGVAFAVAIFIHFRAIFYAPWAVFAGWNLVRDRAYRGWCPRQWVAFGAAAALAAISLYTLVLVTPTLGALPMGNPIHPGHLRPAAVAAVVAAVGVAAGLFVRNRAYLVLAVLVWMTAMLVNVRQVQAWHTFMLLPWIFAPTSSAGVRLARMEWVAVVTIAVIL